MKQLKVLKAMKKAYLSLKKIVELVTCVQYQLGLFQNKSRRVHNCFGLTLIDFLENKL